MNKEINVKKLFLLWQIIAELESVLWEIYFDEFMQLCIENPPDIRDQTGDNNFTF
jgi:hypothetical protein